MKPSYLNGNFSSHNYTIVQQKTLCRRPHQPIHACVILYILTQTQDCWSHKTRVFPLRGTKCAKLWKSVFALPSLPPTVFLNTMNSDVLLSSCRSAVFLILYSRKYVISDTPSLKTLIIWCFIRVGQ